MNYIEIKPSPPLSKYIDYYWSLTVNERCETPSKEIRLPDDSPEWIFATRADHATPNGIPANYISLKYKDNAAITRPNVTYFAIRFRPFGLSALGNVNMRDFQGGSYAIDPELIFPDLNNRINEIVSSVASFQGKVQLVETILEERLSKSSAVDMVIKGAVKDIANTHGNITIKSLYQKYGLSKATFHRKFINFIGLSPKELAKIHRFNFFLTKKLTNGQKTLAELALETGYYDQSHLNHEFKSMIGITPSQFFEYSPSVIVQS